MHTDITGTPPNFKVLAQGGASVSPVQAEYA